MLARLHTVAITAMLRTRLQRSASSAIGMPANATVTETMETSAPSALSDTPHSPFM
jgi:hypothetical protein